jgi:hypothetical protein
MRKTTLRRLEALEKEERSRKERELSSLREAVVYIRQIVLAYYVGDLNSDEECPGEAEARALKYPSERDYGEALCKVVRKKDINARSELDERFNDAYRRLFAKVGVDFDSATPNVLFDAFVTMVDQLPEQWLRWLRCNLQEWCSDAEIAVGSNIPRGLSSDNFLLFQRR